MNFVCMKYEFSFTKYAIGLKEVLFHKRRRWCEMSVTSSFSTTKLPSEKYLKIENKYMCFWKSCSPFRHPIARMNEIVQT